IHDFTRTLHADVPVHELFAWHERPGAFERLTPPWQDVRVVARDGGIRDGATVQLRVSALGVPTTWQLRHRDYARDTRFVDEMQDGPFAHWVHTHRFFAESERRSRLEDHVAYALPM